MHTAHRQYSILDKLCLNVQQGLRTLLGPIPDTGRANPADSLPEQPLTTTEKQHSAAMMRVNHAGEIAAQALYQGHALTARDPATREKMTQAAFEEYDHLRWCESRLAELGSHKSYLSPVWYLGSLSIGVLSGLAGDKWNLGFVAATEDQVVAHLEAHLARLPEKDVKSQAIVKQMQADEAHHAEMARGAGGAALPEPILKLMGLTSKVMTLTASKI